MRLPEQDCGQGHGPATAWLQRVPGTGRRAAPAASYDVDRTNRRTANHGADQSAARAALLSVPVHCRRTGWRKGNYPVRGSGGGEERRMVSDVNIVFKWCIFLFVIEVLWMDKNDFCYVVQIWSD